MTLNPLSNNRDLASCRKSWNRRPSIPQSSFSFVKRFHSVHLFTQKIGLSASWTTFPGALSCSVSAFNALLDNGIVLGLSVLVCGIWSVWLWKLISRFLMLQISPSRIAVSTATIIILGNTVERDAKKPLCKVTAGKGLGYWRITLASDISLITALAYSDITHDSVSMYVQYSAMASLMGKKDLEKRRKQKRDYMRRKRAVDPDIWRY